MPAVPSRREQIWRRMLAALQQITVANGYEVDVPFLRRGNYNLLSAPAYPAVLLLPDSDEPESGPYSVNRRTLKALVVVWVRDADSAESPYPLEGSLPSTLPTQLETVLTSVTRALMRDPRWGGLAEHTDEGRTEYILVDSQSPEGGATVEYTVQYRTSIEDSTVPPAVLAMTASWPDPETGRQPGDEPC